jgi:thiamine transport system permease protein
VLSGVLYKNQTRQWAAVMLVAAIGAFVMVALITLLVFGLDADFLLTLDAIKPVIVFTLWQALVSTVLSVCLGLIVALALYYSPRLRSVLLLFSIPLSLPAIVAIMGVLTLLGRNGLIAQVIEFFGFDWKPDIYGLSGIILLHVFFNMPLAVRIIVQSLQNTAVEYLKLASCLSFSAWDRFCLLQWPLVKSVLPQLSGLIFLLCVSSYTIILVLGGGPNAVTLQVGIYQALSFDFDVSRVMVLTCVQILIGVILVWVLPEIDFNSSGSFTAHSRLWFEIRPIHSFLNSVIIFFGSAFIGSPIIAVIIAGLNVDHVALLTDPLLWQALLTSIFLGSISSFLALCISWILSTARYRLGAKGNKFNKILRAMPLLMLTLPPMVLGVGWFIFLIKTGMSLHIAPVLIIIVNVLMALPFVMQTIEPKLHQTFEHYDKLAYSLGMAGFARLKLIELPLMRSTVRTAFLFAFALSLGDLGVVTLFGSDNMLTLPFLIYQKMGSYRSNDASGLALYLALLTIVVAYFSTKGARFERT